MFSNKNGTTRNGREMAGRDLCCLSVVVDVLRFSILMTMLGQLFFRFWFKKTTIVKFVLLSILPFLVLLAHLSLSLFQ